MTQREQDRLVRLANRELPQDVMGMPYSRKVDGGTNVVAEVVVCMVIWVVALLGYIVHRLL